MFASFNVDNYTLRELLGNGKTYTVPPFQRDYSWEQEQWEDLWLDVLDIVQAPKPEHHYMAYVLLKKNGNDNNNFSIIDGQQILTTISIMILCILRYIEKNAQTHHENYEHDFERSKIIRSTYIGALDAVTLLTQSKLNLNKNNNFYYQKYLVPLRPLPTRGHKASELLLRSASEWFDKKIDAYIKTKKILSHDTSKELSLLVEKMADNLFFTVITVTDELNAYTVFETLNARGVKLSASDLFKNYLFSLIYNADETDNTEMNELSERWTQLSVRLENNNFTEFLRCYWIGHYKSVRQLSLFKEIQKTMNTQEKAYQLLKDLEECVETYINLANPNSGIFTGDTKKYAMILKDFNVKQFYCLVLASTRILSETELTKLLKIFVVISFRYNVIASLPPYELEAYYQKIALDITNGNIKNLNDIIHALRDIYVSDDKFETDFTQASLSNKKIITYILSELEAQTGGTKPQVSEYTIEHIMPQNANPDNWAVSDSELNAFVNRLGNLALLEAGKNNKLGDKPYADKKAVFEQSCFVTTQNIAEKYSDWTIDTIEGRQHAMAKIAKTIWRIPQYA